MSIIFHLDNGDSITVPVVNIIGGSGKGSGKDSKGSKNDSNSVNGNTEDPSYLENLVDIYNVTQTNGAELEVKIKPEFTSVFPIYIDYLLGNQPEVTDIKTLMALFDLEDLYEDSNFLGYLTEQAYKMWDNFLPYLANFYLDTAVMLRTPYIFLPDKLKSNKQFFHAEGGWLDFNSSSQVTLNGREVFTTNVTEWVSLNGPLKNLVVRYRSRYQPRGRIHEETWYNDSQDEYQVEYQVSYKDGWKDDWEQGFYRNGQRTFLFHYKHDELDGSQEEWYEDGRPKYVAHYVKGRRVSEQHFQ